MVAWISKSRPVFNVTDDSFGAVGDGVTNNRTTIQAAITAAVAAGGNCDVYLPTGVYVIDDVDTSDHSLASDGPIIIPAGARGIRIHGPSATLKIGPNGISTACIRIYGSNCEVSGLMIDVNYAYDDGNQAGGSTTRRAKGNSGIQITSSVEDNGSGTGGADNLIQFVRIYGGYTGDSVITQGNEGIVVAGNRNRISHCYVKDSTWQSYRLGGDDNELLYCTAWNHRGNGVRVTTDHESTTIIGFRSSSTRNHGRHAIICDPGSGTNSFRCKRFIVKDAVCYCNPTAISANGGAAHVLKIASCNYAHISDSHFSVGDAAQANGTSNQAVRIEDSTATVIFEDCRIEPQMFLGEADNTGSVLFQGYVTSVANNGGYCDFTLAGTGTPTIEVGKSLFVMGSAVPEYNREHLITARTGWVVKTNIPYTTGAIGSVCYARTTIDTVILKRCEFGMDSIVDTQQLDEAMIKGCSARVLDIEDCVFNQRWNSASTYNAINWGVIADDGYDRLRIVNSTFVFNVTASGRGRAVEPVTATALCRSGKIISYGNKLINFGTGGVGMTDSSGSNLNRRILFSTDGESVGKFVWNDRPNVSDVSTIFRVGDEVRIEDKAIRYQFVQEGVSGTSASLYAWQGVGYHFANTASGTAVADFDANEEVSATPTTGFGTVSFGYLRALFAGESFDLFAAGTFSSTGTPNLNFGVSLGKSQVGNGGSGSPPGTAAETGRAKLMEVGAFAVANNAAALRWEVECKAIATSIGSTGTVQVRGIVRYETATNTWVEKIIGVSDISPVNTSRVTDNRKVDVWASWGTKNASNSFVCTQFLLKPH